MNSAIISLIFAIAIEIQVPPCFVLAIALNENESLNPLAVSKQNNDGTVDRGIMQLNSQYFDIEWWIPETNIRAGCLLIKELKQKPWPGEYGELLDTISEHLLHSDFDEAEALCAARLNA
jgi:soluble lytic murein transglycosylase-like protein